MILPIAPPVTMMSPVIEAPWPFQGAHRYEIHAVIGDAVMLVYHGEEWGP